MKVLIHGLGLHGGGTAAARYFAQRGCTVRITDLRDADCLKPSIDTLTAFPDITWSLGGHKEKDFTWADLVIKGPSVPWNSPYLKLSSRIETDISWLLQHSQRELIVITGTKGKSTTAQLIYSMLLLHDSSASLGGNVGVSGFSLLEEGKEGPLVLELSSWQLRDLENLQVPYAPRLTVITSIYPDHLDAYGELSSYLEDKALAVQASGTGMCILDSSCFAYKEITDTIPSHGDLYVIGNHAGCRSAACTQGELSWAVLLAGTLLLDIPAALVTGMHTHCRNIIASVLAAHLLGISASCILEGLASWKPLPHRMEFLEPVDGITCINVSASTILESTVQALDHCEGIVHLILGGSDKHVPLSSLPIITNRCASIHLLEGNFSRRLLAHCYTHDIPCSGPFTQMEDAVTSAFACAEAGSTVLLSPGSASFGSFANAYERGERFREAVERLRAEKRRSSSMR